MSKSWTGWRSVVVGVVLGAVAATASSERLSNSGVSAILSGAASSTQVNAQMSGSAKQLRIHGNQLLTVDAAGSLLTLQLTGAKKSSRSWPLPEVRRDASLTMLPDGRVLIWGGHDERGVVSAGGLWFDPDLRVLEPTDHLPMSARAEHTATVLTDGRVMFAGGRTRGIGYEVWTPETNRLETLDSAVVPSPGHQATLLANGQVRLFGGVGALPDGGGDLLFDPLTNQVVRRAADISDVKASGLAGSLPAQGESNVSIDERIALRFTEPVRLEDLGEANFTLFGPGGAAAVRVVAAEGGRLAFIKSTRQLFPDTPYTILADGLTSQLGKKLPLISVDFRTAALDGGGDQPSTSAADQAEASGTLEAEGVAGQRYCSGKSSKPTLCNALGEMKDGIWTPGLDNLGDNWRVPGRQPEAMYLGFMPPLFEALKLTALTGSVLRVDGKPVAGVAVSVGTKVTHTDATGRFLLYDVPSGRQKVYVDGTAANAPGAEYGQFVVGADIKTNTLTQVPFTMWLPRIAARDKFRIPSPTTQDMVIKHPDLPGMELHIPKGTVIRDHKGNVLTEVAIVPTPVNRSPYPLPTSFPMYFTLQPGGSVLQGLTSEAGRGASVYYPNYDHYPAGTAADFWLYDAMEGWRVYGQGRVTADETQFAPEPGVSLHEVVTFGAAVSPSDPAPEEGLPPEPQACGECNAGTGSNATAGDPIDLKTGRFSYQETDIVISDILPIALDRNYRPSDRVKREFGYGTAAGFAYRLSLNSSDYSQLQLVLPNGTALVFNQTSGSGAYGSWRYDGKAGLSGATLSTVSTNGYNYILTARDGSQMAFEPHSPNRLLWTQDRYGNRTEYVYDAGLVSRIVGPTGRYIDLNYDSQKRISSANDMVGTTWRYEYNDKGLLAKVIYPDDRFRQYEYQSWGSGSSLRHRLSAIYDQRGNRVLHNEYEEAVSSSGATETTGRVIRQTLADGAVYQIQYDHVDGSTTGTLVTHPDGSQRRVVFGDGMYPLSDTLAYGTPLQQVYQFERDDDGRLTARIDPLGRRTEYEYDEFGQLIRTTALAGTDKAVTSLVDYTDEGKPASFTDALGHVTSLDYVDGCLSRVTNPLGKSTTFACNAAGQIYAATDALSHTTELQYDGADVVAVTDPLGRQVVSRYDTLGRPVASEDMQGHLSRREYDAQGRGVRMVSPDGGTTEVGYDANGNTAAVLLPHGAGITYEYDERDRVIKRTDSLGQSESWTYDVMSRVTSHTDRKQQVTRYSYDTLGRSATTTYADGSTVVAGYDAGDRLRSLQDSISGTLGWNYDDLDRIIEATSPQGNIAYDYDVLGRRISMTAAGQAAVEYRYDDASQLRKILQGTEVVEFDYDDIGRRTRLQLPNNVQAGYAYDPASQLTGLAWLKPDGSSLGTLGYAYDRSGLIVAQTGTMASQALPQPSTGNAFDDNNRQTQHQGQSLSYDDNGNLTEDGSRTYVWNARNQLAQILEGGEVIASFGYDALGRRYTKTEVGQQVDYLYDGLDAVQENVDHAVVPILTGLNIDERFRSGSGLGARYFITDLINSTRMLTDSDGGLLSEYDYDPYGGSSSSVSMDGANYFYSGREVDLVGLYYYRARYYNSRVGGFIGEDPMGLSAGFNYYSYVNGDPVSWRDPLGLQRFRPAPKFSRPGGGNSQQRAIWNAAQLRAIRENSHSTPIYTRGLTPEEVGTAENLASILTDVDYTQYCASAICRNNSNSCAPSDVVNSWVPSNPTVAQVNAQGCMCAMPYYSDTTVADPVANTQDWAGMFWLWVNRRKK